MASRRSTSTYGHVGPMSRQVVKPAFSVTSAFAAPHNASCPGVVFTSASSQCTPRAPVRCVCRSIRPGSSVAAPRSMTRAPDGTGSVRPTATMRSPSMRTIAGSSGVPPFPSTSRAARTMVTAALRVAAGGCASALETAVTADAVVQKASATARRMERRNMRCMTSSCGGERDGGRNTTVQTQMAMRT